MFQGDYYYYRRGSITIVRTGAFQDLLKLVKIDLTYNEITSVEDNAFSNLPQLTELNLGGNDITLFGANAFSNLTQLTMLKGASALWQTGSVADMCVQASSQIQTAAFTRWCNQQCDTSGTVIRCNDKSSSFHLTEVPTTSDTMAVNNNVTEMSVDLPAFPRPPPCMHCIASPVAVYRIAGSKQTKKRALANTLLFS